MSAVMAVNNWSTNADLIADVARLGYLNAGMDVLDPTYGHGTWWLQFRPDRLVACDLDPAKSPIGPVDFTALPFVDGSFDAVAFDPPYKLNGTATESVDKRYGVHTYDSVAGRHRLILDGVTECARVLRPGGFLLVKCQDQVSGGKVRWQGDLVTRHAAGIGLDKVDAFHMLSYRPQPAGRTQQHARRNHSSLLVFVKPTRGRA